MEALMPIIYLSPSTQENNFYVTGSGSEEYNMNLLADAMTPYLLSNGIQFKRNTPDMTAASSIRQANSGSYDFYLALHSNASGEGQYGENRGIIAFYYPGSIDGKRAAEIFAKNLREIYPLPSKVQTQSTTSLGEVRQPNFPSVLLEIGYHDNYADAVWVETHMDEIAQNLVLSLTEYFGLPFIWPVEVRYGTVVVENGTLNLRSTPSSDGTVIANMPSGSTVGVYGEWQGWYVVHYGAYVGYAAAAYIMLP
jgi:N-acetylmuramoyl-L-alanine amidase